MARSGRPQRLGADLLSPKCNGLFFDFFSLAVGELDLDLAILLARLTTRPSRPGLRCTALPAYLRFVRLDNIDPEISLP